MTTKNSNSLSYPRSKASHSTVLLLSMAFMMRSLSLVAAETDLASKPLSNNTAAEIKPNLLLLLDVY